MSLENEIQNLTAAVDTLADVIRALVTGRAIDADRTAGTAPAPIAPAAAPAQTAEKPKRAKKAKPAPMPETAPETVAAKTEAERPAEKAIEEPPFNEDDGQNLTPVAAAPKAEQPAPEADKAAEAVPDKAHFMAQMTDFFRVMPSSVRKTAMQRVLSALGVSSFNDIAEADFSRAIALAKAELAGA